MTTNVRVVARGRNLRRAAAVEARVMASTPPWQRPRPPGPRAALTPAQRAGLVVFFRSYAGFKVLLARARGQAGATRYLGWLR